MQTAVTSVTCRKVKFVQEPHHLWFVQVPNPISAAAVNLQAESGENCPAPACFYLASPEP